MLQKSRELILALLAIVIITLAYLLMRAVTRQVPAASGLWGHSLGILGFLLMLMTETLYSLRKRSRRGARWGKMSNWLEFHIFTGLVGPYMVLIHPGWQFRGLAGVLSLFTLLMVISGFIGRYIYTAVPRTAAGAEISLLELENSAQQLELELARLKNEETSRPRPPSTHLTGGTLAVLSRFWDDLLAFLSDLDIRLRQSGQARQKALQLTRLRRAHLRIRRQINSLAAARRLLALWHTIHIPLGLTLFMLAFVHIGATIYYAVLLY